MQETTSTESNIWTTLKVKELLDQMEYNDVKRTPFWDGKPEWRLGNIVFEYTPEELDEIKKCAADVMYFANNYCFVMTDDGVRRITLRDYQEDVLRDFQSNKKCILLSSRQSGKTICTGIFLTWYLLFNTDKNLMVLSDVGATTVEIIDKIKVILSNLPFFLKPGVMKNDVMTMKFDNGCRLFGRNTTRKAGIGFAIHFLYCDEFAHIHQNFLDPFWRTIYPTLSSSKISRCILTSTPNGPNLFHDLYVAALEGTNSFHPMRVDWWQVPDRDEKWKQFQIADLGSEEKFNQEFGVQFLSAESLLLDSKTLQRIKTMIEEYKWTEIEQLHDKNINHEDLKWHPKFNFDNVKPSDKFVFTIDTAGGGGGDFSVVNIFKVIPMPIQLMDKNIGFRSEYDFFSMLQIGIFRSNKIQIEELVVLVETLLYDVFKVDNVKIVLEMDFKGNLLFEKMSTHKDFYEEIFIHTKHSEAAAIAKPGIKLNPKNKMEFCFEMRRLMKAGRIITCEKRTFEELAAFGVNKKGSYSSQIGHDDCAMTIVNLSTFFNSNQYLEIVGDIYDTLEDKYKKVIAVKMNAGNIDEVDEKIDMDFLRGLMST